MVITASNEGECQKREEEEKEKRAKIAKELAEKERLKPTKKEALIRDEDW